MGKVNKIRFMVLSSLMVMMIMALAPGCDTRNGEENGLVAVKPVQLTAGEEWLVKNSGPDFYAVFDILIPAEVEGIEYWVDYYYRGSFQEKIFIGAGSVSSPGEKRMFFARVPVPGESEEIWSLALNGKRMSKIMEPYQLEGATMLSALQESIHVPIGETQPLLVLTKSPGPMEGPDQDFLAGRKDLTPEMLRDEHIFILYVKFIDQYPAASHLCPIAQ